MGKLIEHQGDKWQFCDIRWKNGERIGATNIKGTNIIFLKKQAYFSEREYTFLQYIYCTRQ